MKSWTPILRYWFVICTIILIKKALGVNVETTRPWGRKQKMALIDHMEIALHHWKVRNYFVWDTANISAHSQQVRFNFCFRCERIFSIQFCFISHIVYYLLLINLYKQNRIYVVLGDRLREKTKSNPKTGRISSLHDEVSTTPKIEQYFLFFTTNNQQLIYISKFKFYIGSANFSVWRPHKVRFI